MSIRDKIAASKKKGLWMGGPVPLGYQVIDRKLVPVPEEAERVCTIMRRYIASSSANALIAELEAEGIVTKVQQRTSGPHRGGIPFRRGSLFHLLKNPIHRGMIVHKGKVYPGEHPAIVDEELWEKVQARLAEKAPPRKRPTNDPQRALLSGLLADPEGRQIVATYPTKGSRRYVYYETRKDLARPADPPSTRFGQGALDRHVVDHIARLLDDEHALRRMAKLDEAESLRRLFACARDLRSRLNQPAEASAVLRSLLVMIRVQRNRLEFTLKPGVFGCEGQPYWNWSISLPARKPFREARLRIDAAGDNAEPDRQLIELLAAAFEAQQLILASPASTSTSSR